MRYLKSLDLPKTKTVTARFTVEQLRREGSLRTLHFRQEGGVLSVAEGEEAAAFLPEGTTDICALEERLYAYNAQKKYLYTLFPNTFVFTFISSPFFMLSVMHRNNVKQRFCISDVDVKRIDSGESYNVGPNLGGVCGAVLGERIFTAKGHRVRFSEALNFDGWKEARGGAGYVDLPSPGGDITAAVAYKEKLYFFRERGITQLRVLGDDLNFKAVTLPCGSGDICGDTVKICGGKIFFLTENGLYSFDGGVCKREESELVQRLDLTGAVRGGSCHGRYYAFAPMKAGGNAIYCFDPETGLAHFALRGAETIAAGHDLYFKREGKAYRITERGLPFEGECVAETEDLLVGGEKLLDAVVLEGERSFEVTVSTRGDSRKLACAAGEETRIPVPLRGTCFALKISTQDTQARLSALKLIYREEKNGH